MSYFCLNNACKLNACKFIVMMIWGRSAKFRVGVNDPGYCPTSVIVKIDYLL